MIEGFDKEIDSLLRRAATGESVRAFDAHPEADEILLFAENVLPAKARARTAEHLAECAKCRKILSHLISFNAEAESETIHAGESNIIPVVAPVIPWYRRLFAFPQITFAMGALALVFAGVLAFMVLQNAGDMSRNTTVARREEISETSKGVSGAGADGEAQTVETYPANSNATSVNPASPVNPSLSTANTGANSMNTNTASTADATLPAVRQQQQTLPENNEPLAKTEQPKPAAPSSEQQQTSTTPSKPEDAVVTGSMPKDAKQQPPAGPPRKEEDSERKREDARDDLNDSTQLAGSRTENGKSLRAKKTADADKNKAGEARSVNGKTFRNVGGIWFDSAYTSQSPVMIRRGSDDYKRLDSGLRTIAESLGGTIVVVWKSRAYRIQ